MYLPRHASAASLLLLRRLLGILALAALSTCGISAWLVHPRHAMLIGAASAASSAVIAAARWLVSRIYKRRTTVRSGGGLQSRHVHIPGASSAAMVHASGYPHRSDCQPAMTRFDISDEHVLALAERWRLGWQTGAHQPAVVAALVAEGVPEKMALAKVQHMCRRGLMDYATSPHHAWPR
jgi:hypothetical protein